MDSGSTTVVSIGFGYMMIKKKGIYIFMNKKEFEELTQNVKTKNPGIFGLDSDCKPTDEDIDLMEKYYNIVFPKSYKEFLLQYGGGYFAYTIVYSLDILSPFYVKKNVLAEFINDNNFFPIIDFETGDLAGFKIDNGICEDAIVLYSHEEKIISDTKLNFYDALGKYGLKLSQDVFGVFELFIWKAGKKMDKIFMMVNEWDPIGFFPMAPEDEYINEIKEIYEYLNVSENITEKKLAKKINEIFIMAFGSDVYVEDIEGCLKVAKGILNSQ